MNTSSAISKEFVCSLCSEPHLSRNALFRHLRGHVVREQGDGDLAGPASSGDEVRTHYEDEFIQVVVKPQGLPTMGTRGEMTLHASDALLLPPSASYSSKYKKAVPVHRLDRMTGGLVVCSKSKVIETFLKSCFENKSVCKRYRAICPGRINPTEGIIDSPIDGRAALTRYKVVTITTSRNFKCLTTVDLWPVSGRRHQLYFIIFIVLFNVIVL